MLTARAITSNMDVLIWLPCDGPASSLELSGAFSLLSSADVVFVLAFSFASKYETKFVA